MIIMLVTAWSWFWCRPCLWHKTVCGTCMWQRFSTFICCTWQPGKQFLFYWLSSKGKHFSSWTAIKQYHDQATAWSHVSSGFTGSYNEAVSTSQSVAEAIDKLLPSSSGSVRVNGKDKYSCSYITSETNQSEWHPNDKYM